jgi:hypothetical protein
MLVIFYYEYIYDHTQEGLVGTYESSKSHLR